ncbi:hypothetical protein [Arenimonas terrae]|uniref:Bacterial Pleckstrin homology domain-containing protein n=1 Tax=Arenimonas terrae TaxID=2546226 RepID=A0A5C4RT16_9GAMM|nr:hypothetical protein [Arenimonas terrae]TNJ34356.1 hypothetical protein E1B00_00760 [Arenimonas terrae]
MDRRLALTPLGKAPVLFAIGFGAVLPLVIAVVVILQVRSEALSPAFMLLIQGVVAVSVLAVVLPMWRREASFDGRRLRVKATFYTREAPLADFDLAAARAVDLREHTELQPRLKTNGFALPGFQAGHFRLRDRRKAFCLVTDPSKVLALPHADGRVWLLSLEHPQAVLDILRRAAG